MLKMFKRKSKKAEQEKAALFLARAITGLQTRWANWLSKQEQKMSVRQKKVALFIFCAVLSIVSGAALYKGLFGHYGSSSSWFKQESIQAPPTIPFPDSLELMRLYEREKKRQIEQDSIHP